MNMGKMTEFNILILELYEPVYVIGRAVRVKHGTPECFPAISSLISGFFADNMPYKILNKIEPIVRFGICSNHIYYDDVIEFTYLTGVQVQGPVGRNDLPETTVSFTIPTGSYVCIKVSAPDEETAIGTAYVKLDEWIKESSEWESFPGEYEVYPKESTDAVMELWRPIKRKI